MANRKDKELGMEKILAILRLRQIWKRTCNEVGSYSVGLALPCLVYLTPGEREALQASLGACGGRSLPSLA